MESTIADGPVGQWIEKNSEEAMILGFNVDNMWEAIKDLEPKSYSFIPAPVFTRHFALKKIR